MRNSLKKWLSASTLVAVVFAVSNHVEAGYGSGGGSSGYGAGYGSSGGYYGGSSGGGSSGGGSSGGHVGPLRRLGARIHDHLQAKVAYRASYGSSGGSSGGAYTANYGSSGGSHGGYVTRSAGSSGGGSSGGAYYGSTHSSGGSTGSYVPAYGAGSSGSYGGTGSYGGSSGSYGGSTGSTIHSNYENYAPEVPMFDQGYSSGSLGRPESSAIQLATSPRTQPSSTQTVNKLASSQSIQPNEVHLTVNLPESAKVFVNGNPTTTSGSKRHFVSRDLKPKDAYRFEVKAVLTKPDGSDLVQTRTVVVESGNGEELNFEMLNADDPIETILTLNVPETAKVVLAKNSTKSEGASRIFRTKQLREGESWDDYKIEVTHDGVTKEKTIRLMAGDKLELTFNFESTDSANKVAMN